jgi:hypothetical protein
MFNEALSELKDRFMSERPVTDPHRERDRIDRDSYKEVFARAESFARMGPPIDATLKPITAPENVQLRVSSGLGDTANNPSNMAARGSSRGLEAGRNALVQECGWSLEEAEALKREAERGDMTESQFMRVVEDELQQSETSGQLVSPPTQSAPGPVDRRKSSGRFVSEKRRDSGIARGDNGQFQNVEEMVHSRRGGQR